MENIKAIAPVGNSYKFPKDKESGIPCEKDDECLTNEKCAGKEGNKKCILSMEETGKRVVEQPGLALREEEAAREADREEAAREAALAAEEASTLFQRLKDTCLKMTRASSKSKRKKRKKTKKKLKKTKKHRKKTNKRNREINK